MDSGDERWRLKWRKKLYELRNRTRNAGANRARDFLSEVTERRILERLELSAGLSVGMVAEYATEVYEMYVAEIDKDIEGARSVILQEIEELDRRANFLRRDQRSSVENALITPDESEEKALLSKRESLCAELKDLAEKKERCGDILMTVFSDKEMSWSRKDPEKLENKLSEGLSMTEISKTLGFIA